MAEYTPTIESVAAVCAITWTYDPTHSYWKTTSRSSGSGTREIDLSAIPNGAQITDVSFSWDSSNRPSAIGTEYRVARFDSYDGSNLTSESIKAYLDALGGQYAGEKIKMYFGAKAANSTAQSNLGNLTVTFTASLTITYMVYVFYGDTGEWVPCEIYFGANGEWVQVMPYKGVNGEWVQA